ncbi:MAG TPA: dihydropteroate synthase [Acidimicrobiia bacterium]|nr:dihydropteroate synthase [Acidimicrobiia bacterium]
MNSIGSEIKPSLRVGNRLLPFGAHTWVMAVINLSPESRNLHTIAPTTAGALTMARRYREMGAAIIDLGGQSSHFQGPTIPDELEIARLLPTIEALAKEDFVISVDTWKPEVARAALAAGAQIVNDTGGLADPEMRKVVAEWGIPVVAVYVEGANPHAVVALDTGGAKARRTAGVFADRLALLGAEGIDQVIIDPGIALNYPSDYQAYTRLQLEVIRESAALHELGRPVLIPIPRKKEDHRVMAYITLALEYGADLIRVHDVEAACDLVELFGRTGPGLA